MCVCRHLVAPPSWRPLRRAFFFSTEFCDSTCYEFMLITRFYRVFFCFFFYSVDHRPFPTVELGNGECCRACVESGLTGFLYLVFFLFGCRGEGEEGIGGGG